MLPLYGITIALLASAMALPQGQKPGKPGKPGHSTSSICPTTTSANPSPSDSSTPNPNVKRVAIVGSGSSGASAAYFLARAARQVEAKTGGAADSLVELTVFEKDNRIGGRAHAIHPKDNPAFRPEEIGGSLITPANQNLAKLLSKFGLSKVPGIPSQLPGVAIWNGQEIVYKFGTSASIPIWTSEMKAFEERYGQQLIADRVTNSAVDVVRTFGQLYNASNIAARGPVDSVSAFAEASNLGARLTDITGSEWARSAGNQSEAYIQEYLEANTRSNYGIGMDEIHGLGAAVSLSALQAFAVDGGNSLIFEHMIEDSKASIKLETAVSNIEQKGSAFAVTAGASTEEFDQVFFAAPWHASPVAKSIQFEAPIPETPYVQVHVTLLTVTNIEPKVEYFNANQDTYIPWLIVTTGAGERAGGPAPDFDIIMYRGMAGSEYIVKIHSQAYLSDEKLAEIFDVTWVSRHVFDAFPVMHAQPTYPPMEPLPGFHYLASFEPWVSTLETQTISAREAVARVAEEWWGLGLGDCSNGESWDMTC